MPDETLEQTLLERVIPLPKQAQFAGVLKLPASGCGIVAASSEPVLRTAVDVLHSAIPGSVEGTADFTLRLVVMVNDGELRGLPNADQAYRIRPLAGAQPGLELAGTTAEGVLFAARTLAQLVRVASPGSQSPVVEMPLATTLDWPDMSERGQWGGDTIDDLPHTAALKMNLLEVGIVPHYDEQGKLGISLLTPPICEQARRLGVKAVIYVPHLGDLGKYSNLFQFRPELMSTPDPTQPLPADYKPNICFSKPGAPGLLADIMEQVIRELAPCGLEMNIWLTEEGTPCYCDDCRGQNPYVLETRLLAAAYGLVKQRHPDFRLRILLTQGSYPVNDRILAEVPPDMGVTYYSGTHTYDSSHQPMIYPLLEDYAARHWLGVVPQVDNCWRTVFPFTCPQFIRFRMREFAAKGLQSVTGYATPSNRFWAFNVAGLAEWSWNANGRSERQFARAWAVRQAMPDPDAFADWACLIGPLGWDLAGSRFPMRLFWDPARGILEKPEAMVFGDGLLAEVPSPEDMEKSIALARHALAMAEKLDLPACLAEAQAVLNSYLFLKALAAISRLPRNEPELKSQLAAQLALLDEAAEAAVRGIWDWGCLVCPETPQKPHHRFEETLSVFAQVVTEAYRLAGEAGIPDPHPAYRNRRVGAWTEKDFVTTDATPRLDVTDYLSGPGPYRVWFNFLGGGYGADICAVSFLRQDSQGVQEVARIEPKANGYGDNSAPPHIGRYEAWNDVRLDLTAVDLEARYFVQATLGGLPEPGSVPAERRTSSGEVCLRKAWA